MTIQYELDKLITMNRFSKMRGNMIVFFAFLFLFILCFIIYSWVAKLYLISIFLIPILIFILPLFFLQYTCKNKIKKINFEILTLSSPVIIALSLTTLCSFCGIIYDFHDFFLDIILFIALWVFYHITVLFISLLLHLFKI